MDSIGAAVVQHASLATKSPSSHKKQEACNWWNNNLCLLDSSQCCWLHVCNKCSKGGHKAPDCPSSQWTCPWHQSTLAQERMLSFFILTAPLTITAGGNQKMISISHGSSQPQWEPWTIDWLVHERSIALGFSIDNSSHITYTSALNSYLTFCRIHNFNIEPMEQTLSFFAVYMSSHIKPSLVNSYLSRICNQLEPFFPNVWKSCNSMLVSRTMTGCQCHFGTPVKHKHPLSTDDLKTVISVIGTFPQPDIKLFLAMLLTRFHGLMHLGKLTFPNSVTCHDYRKVILQHTVDVTNRSYSFLLPGHKANCTYEGNLVIIEWTKLPTGPHSFFKSYLTSQDHIHPLKPELWLHESGIVLTHSWFIKQLCHFFPSDIAGQSMHAGGATSLAEAGVPPNVIQAIGWWALNTFQIYIRKNPVLLQAMLFGHSAHQPANTWLTQFPKLDYFSHRLFHGFSHMLFLFWPLTTSLQSPTLNLILFSPFFLPFPTDYLPTSPSLPFPHIHHR